MTRGQRRAHFAVWVLLLPLLAAVLAVALMRRTATRETYLASPTDEAAR